MADKAGKVYLVGAGPGAPDLITLRGAQMLGRAEVVIYDHLVSAELIDYAPDSAELIYAGKRGGVGARVDQAALNRLLVERAQAGRTVVRLKGGDPFIFGRGGEEAAALAAAGIDFEIVPGLTSAIAVPAFAGIPLTHRDYGSFVAFVTAHEGRSKASASAVPWAELARATRKRGTLVLLMAAARMRESLARLRAGRLPPKTPAAAIQSGTTAAQRTVLATVATLADEAERAGLRAPAVVVVGQCAGLRERLQWFERRPLFGRRIVVTRERRAAARFAAQLRALGAEAIGFPTIETVAPRSYRRLDAAIARLTSFDWVIFTSATGVERFVARLRALHRDIRELGRASIAAIGPATAAAAERYALQVAARPAEYRAEAIAGAIGAERIRGARFLIPRAQAAREALPEILTAGGAIEVEVAPAYRTVKPAGARALRMREMIEAGSVDLVAFTSSSTVSNFCELVGPSAGKVRAAAIGPITAATARALGLEVVVRPEKYTVEGLVGAIAEYFAAKR